MGRRPGPAEHGKPVAGTVIAGILILLTDAGVLIADSRTRRSRHGLTNSG